MSTVRMRRILLFYVDRKVLEFMKKRILSVALAVCVLMTCFVVANYTATAVTTDKSVTAAAPDTYSEITANPYGITDSNDDATILQCWNWSYANLEKEIPKIAQQGFSVVQISPPNEIKEATKNAKVTQSDDKNGWWMFYQPAGFQLNQSTDNALGTKTELIKMVKTAHSYGVRVIADSVINHMGTCDNENSISSSDPMAHVTPKAKEFEPEIYNNKLFHSPWFNMTYQYEWSGPQDTCTNDLTRGCTSRLPDLKTEDARVQSAIYDYLKEMVDCGIDGFRFDAAKHIETPNDLAKYRSDFWTNTVSKVRAYAKSTYKKDVLSYGEILNTCGYGRSYNHYYPFMKVTDSTIYRQIQKAVVSSSPSQAIPQRMANGSNAQTVLWDESHDTYMDGESKSFSTAQRNKTWAAIAARSGITSMYLARPASLTQALGVASETDWTKKEVAEVNKFNNNYAGQGEYLSNASGVAVIGRGSKTQDGGAVLINCSGTTKAVSGLTVATMADGKYTDRVSGTTFTVSGGKVSGSIGATGVAVLYNEPGPTVSATESGSYFTDNITIKLNCKNVDYATYEYNGSAPQKYESGASVTLGTAADKAGATYKVTLKGYVKDAVATTQTYTYTKANQESEYNITFKTNNQAGWTSVCIYAWNSANEAKVNAKWPGVKMTGSGGTYTATIPNTFDRVIFNNNNNKRQTVDIIITGSMTYTLKSSPTQNADGTYIYDVTEKSDAPTEPTYYPGQGDQPTESATATQGPTETDPPASETVTATEPMISLLYGDANLDNVISIKDATAIQEHAAMLKTLTGNALTVADVDDSGTVNVKDATCVQCYLAKLDGAGKVNQECKVPAEK